jgi:low temperature requirement protein LtrA
MAQNNFVQKNVGFNSEAVQEASPQAPITSSQWLSRGNRNRTNLDDVYIETRPFRHAHVLRRPRAMQHYNSSSAISSSSSLFRKTESRDSDDAREGRSTDNVQVQLARVDLFIDLVWVGIVANLSGTFGEQSFSNSGVSIGEATLEYILLFLPMWRLWDNLREYGSDFYKDDLLQRLFVIWILLLCVLYGINAPYAFVPDGGNSLRLVISIYLVARASFLAGYVFQAIFLPFLRLQVLISGIGMMIGSALWIAAMYVPYPAKTALLITANTIEHPMAMYMASPYSARLLTGGWEKKLDFKHYIERIEGFFIIILGEGVFRLIEGSPSGMGLNHKTGTVLTALLLYYVLHWVYFNGDQSREFVHALRRRWWRAFLWKL